MTQTFAILLKQKKIIFNWFFFFSIPFMLGLASLGEASTSKPSRIVTLIPSLAELASELLDNTDSIVGVATSSDFPESLQKKTSIGWYNKVNLEMVRSLKPDLILASKDGNDADQITRLREMKFRVLVVTTSSLAEIRDSIEQVSKALSEEKRGKELVRKFDQELQKIRKRTDARLRKGARPSVLLQLGDEPLIVAGGKTFLNEAIELVGARNTYSDSAQGYPRVSIEDVLTRDPDWILVASLGNSPKPMEKIIQGWNRYPNLKAIRKKQILILKADELLRPGSRLWTGLHFLEKVLFP